MAVGCSEGRSARDASTAAEQVDGPQPGSTPSAQRPVRLALLTDLHGVLEPCGCTPSSAGGADRVAALLTELRGRDSELLFIVAGDSLFPAAKEPPGQIEAQQQQLEANAWVGLLRSLGVDVIAPGPRDFARGASALIDLNHHGSVTVLGTEPPIDGMERYTDTLVRAVGMRRVALAVGSGRQAADLTIHLRHGERKIDEHDARADLVIHSGLDEPRSFAEIRDGVLHASAGRDGEELLLLELWPGAGPGAAWHFAHETVGASKQNLARVERHRLTQERPSDPAVRRLLAQLFRRVNEQNRGLAAPRTARATRIDGSQPPAFMGARTCAACHTEAYFAWRATPHARAYQTLVARGRELDLDCIGCHVTGFDQPRGAALGHLDELLGVGCESCHGPGEAHVNNPHVKQRSVHRAVPEAACRECHDATHGDAFDYSERLQQLLVPGHGLKTQPAR